MKKDISNKNDATKDASKAEKRPKLQSIDGNPSVATVTPKIRRIAQPGDVLFANPSKIARVAQTMGVLFAKRELEYCSIKTKKPPASTSGFWTYIILGVLTPEPKHNNLSLGKCSLKVNFNLQAAKSIAAHKGASKNV
jgi:hypothetical protein